MLLLNHRGRGEGRGGGGWARTLGLNPKSLHLYGGPHRLALCGAKGKAVVPTAFDPCVSDSRDYFGVLPCLLPC